MNVTKTYNRSVFSNGMDSSIILVNENFPFSIKVIPMGSGLKAPYYYRSSHKKKLFRRNQCHNRHLSRDRGIYIVLHLLRHATTFFTVSSEITVTFVVTCTAYNN